MTKDEIWPNGEIELTGRNVEGVDYVILHCTNSATGNPAEIGFRADHFSSIVGLLTDMEEYMIDHGHTAT